MDEESEPEEEKNSRQDEEEEEDPLDALMASIDQQAQKDLELCKNSKVSKMALRLDDLNDKEEYEADQAHLLNEAKYDNEKGIYMRID